MGKNKGHQLCKRTPDTCLALELKLLVKRDFCDMKEASKFYGFQDSDSESSLRTLVLSRQSKNLKQRESLESSSFNADNGSFSESPLSNEFLTDYGLLDEEPVNLPETSDDDDEQHDAVGHLRRTASFDKEISSNNAILLMEEYSGRVLDPSKSGCNGEKPLVKGKHATTHIDWVAVAEQSCSVNLAAANDSYHSSEISDDISLASNSQDDEEEEDFLTFMDTLLICRFCDPILPFELKEIITADPRLLKMLESGLPSWVIFLQSYPVFRKLYRPWMRPLANTMYIIVSVVTVIIGFYDLYKNVPVLKAMASRLCGPFFKWIEAWEMVTRVKYLGTVLFLQNWEKAFRWLILILGTMRKLSKLVFQPMVEPLVDFADFLYPVWNLFLDTVLGVASLLSMMCMSILEYANLIVQLIALPFIWLLTAISSLVAWILYPIIYGIWGFIKLPISLIVLLVDFVVAAFCSIYEALQSFWLLINSSSQLLSASGPQTGNAAKTSASTLRLLWNDIFSQVFRAVRSILNVFVAFLTTCNRHRLSIYNRTRALLSQLTDFVKSMPNKAAAGDHQDLTVGHFENEGPRRSSRGLATTVSRRSRKKESPSGSRSLKLLLEGPST